MRLGRARPQRPVFGRKVPATVDLLLSQLTANSAWLYAPLPGLAFQERSSPSTAATTNGNPLGTIKEYSGVGPDAVAPNDPARPSNTVSGGQYSSTSNGSTSRMVLASNFVATGPCTIYYVGTRNTSASCFPLLANGGNSSYFLYSNNFVFFEETGGSSQNVALTGTDGLQLVRFRRSILNVCFLARTGMAEALMGTVTGTFTVDGLYGNSAIVSDSGVDFRAVAVMANDIGTGGTESSFRAQLVSKFGADL